MTPKVIAGLKTSNKDNKAAKTPVTTLNPPIHNVSPTRTQRMYAKVVRTPLSSHKYSADMKNARYNNPTQHQYNNSTTVRTRCNKLMFF